MKLKIDLPFFSSDSTREKWKQMYTKTPAHKCLWPQSGSNPNVHYQENGLVNWVHLFISILVSSKKEEMTDSFNIDGSWIHYVNGRSHTQKCTQYTFPFTWNSGTEKNPTTYIDTNQISGWLGSESWGGLISNGHNFLRWCRLRVCTHWLKLIKQIQ